MSAPAYDDFIEWLRGEFGESLRWTASFNHETFGYRVRYVREDLKTDLTDLDLQTIHRLLAVFNRDHVEDCVAHLRPEGG